MFLNQILEEYRESEGKQKILEYFLTQLWNSKYTFKKYKKYYKYKVHEDLLDNRQDLIDLFNRYSDIEYIVCKSFYRDAKLKSIDYIRVHINNMYGYLVDKDVYYKKKYYDLLLTPKKEYFRIIKIKKEKGNLNEVDYNEVKQNIEDNLQGAELIKLECINKKHNIKFKEYKEIINIFIEKIFNNYIPAEDYEKEKGWELKVIVDGWSEDNYVIKYFCKSLTGYMRNYIRKLNSGKYIQCTECNKLIKPTNNKNKYCKECAREVNIKKTIKNRKNKQMFEIENTF